MNKSPLIEMAELSEQAVRWHGDANTPDSAAAEYERRQARILRAAAAVILQMQALRDDIAERKIFWPAEVDFAVEALDSYEAACKEEPK